jgi:hypothetical protein
MGWLSRAMFLAGITTVLGGFPLSIDARQDTPTLQPEQQQAAPPDVQHSPEQFSGQWVYNAEESVNAATGRPEQAPRSATQRNPAAPLGAGGAGAGAGRVPAPAPYGTVGTAAAFHRMPPGQLGPTVAMLQENRSLTRDLMEVPQALTIKVTPSAVTFVDDLHRERVYATSGERTRYQLGAARFNAATEWAAGAQLQKRIDAADGFRMTETYFLSEDARRLFVIVRVSSTRKNAPVMGVNRVYDRVEP